MTEIDQPLNIYSKDPDLYRLALSSAGELKALKNTRVKNFYGRVISWCLGDNYNLPVVVEYLRNLPPSELRLVSHNFYDVINQKIDRYNLKNSLSTIQNIVFQVLAEDVSKSDFKKLTLIPPPKVDYRLYSDYNVRCIRWFDITAKSKNNMEVNFSLNLKLSEEGIELIGPVFPDTFQHNELCDGYSFQANGLLPSIFFRYCCALKKAKFFEKLCMYPYDIRVQNYFSEEIFPTEFNNPKSEELELYSNFGKNLSEEDDDLLVKFYLFFLDAANILPHWSKKYSYQVSYKDLELIASLKMKIVEALTAGSYRFKNISFFVQFFHDVDLLIEKVKMLKSQSRKKSAYG